MNNLSLVPLDDLLNEVFNRFDGFVCMGVQKNTKTSMDIYFRRWAGGSATCLGLCDILHTIIEEDYKRDEKELM